MQQGDESLHQHAKRERIPCMGVFFRKRFESTELQKVKNKCFFVTKSLNHNIWGNGKFYNINWVSPSPQEERRCSLSLLEHWTETGTTHRVQHSIKAHAYNCIWNLTWYCSYNVSVSEMWEGDMSSFGHVLPLVLLRKICKPFPSHRASSVHHH